MKKGWLKIGLLMVAISSVAALIITLPIVTRDNSFDFSTLPNLEVLDLKNQYKDLNDSQKEKLKTVVNSKKIETNDEITFIENNPNFNVFEFSDLSESLKSLNQTNARISSLESSIKQIDFNNFDFENSSDLNNLYRYINILDYYKIPLDTAIIEKSLERNYDKNSGLFKVPGLSSNLFSNLILTYNLFRTLKKSNKTLFDKYFSVDKIEKLFIDNDFKTDNFTNKEEEYNTSRLILTILNFLSNEQFNMVINKKNISSWITFWDNENTSKKLEDKLLFNIAVKNFVSITKDLKSRKNLDNEIIDYLKTTSWDSLFLNLVFDYKDDTIVFLTTNNILDSTKKRIDDISNNVELSFLQDIKNTALSFILETNYEANPNRNKIFKGLEDYYKDLSQKGRSQEFAEQWYYFSLIITSGFRDLFTKWDELVGIIAEIIKSDVSLPNSRFLFRSLSMISLANKASSSIRLPSEIQEKILKDISVLKDVKDDLFVFQMIYSLELNAYFGQNTINRNFVLRFAKAMLKVDGGFGMNPASSESSLLATFLISDLIRKAYATDREIITLLRNGLAKYTEKTMFDQKIDEFKNIESIYYLLGIKRLADEIKIKN